MPRRQQKESKRLWYGAAIILWAALGVYLSSSGWNDSRSWKQRLKDLPKDFTPSRSQDELFHALHSEDSITVVRIMRSTHDLLRKHTEILNPGNPSAEEVRLFDAMGVQIATFGHAIVEAFSKGIGKLDDRFAPAFSLAAELAFSVADFWFLLDDEEQHVEVLSFAVQILNTTASELRRAAAIEEIIALRPSDDSIRHAYVMSLVKLQRKYEAMAAACAGTTLGGGWSTVLCEYSKVLNGDSSALPVLFSSLNSLRIEWEKSEEATSTTLPHLALIEKKRIVQDTIAALEAHGMSSQAASLS